MGLFKLGLFKRKPDVEDDGFQCPRCGEQSPEGVLECAMCGRDLREAFSAQDARDRIEAERPPSA